MSYLLDSNLLTRLSQPKSPQHVSARRAIIGLRVRGEQILISPQNLIEFWAVATRPAEYNGLGLTIDETIFEIRKFKRLFDIVEDTPNIFRMWEGLVTKYRILGKNVHDARLAAVMLEHGITHLLTLNSKDVKRFSEITIVDPMEL